MVYYRRRRGGYRKSYRKRYSRGYGRRRTRYPRATRARATKALRSSYKVKKSLYRLKSKLDFQKYYNWSDQVYYIDFKGNNAYVNRNTTSQSTAQGTLLYSANNRSLSSCNIVPSWLRGSTTTSTPLTFNAVNLTTLNEGSKPGAVQNLFFNNPTVQGGRFRCKSLYCRWNFKLADFTDETTASTSNLVSIQPVKVRFCLFTLYEQNNTTEYTVSVNGLGDLTYSPIGSDNNNSYFSESYFTNAQTGNPAVIAPRSAVMAMKNVGSTRLRKVMDRTFTLNRLKTSKIIKCNMFKRQLMKFDTDYIPNPLISGASLLMWPFQQLYYCVMVDNTIVKGSLDGDPHIDTCNGTLYIENQNVLIYYDT